MFAADQGGLFPKPNVGVAGQPNTIPNPGLEVSLHAENNLKLTCFYLCYKKRTSRIVTAAEIDLPVIHQFIQLLLLKNGCMDVWVSPRSLWLM